MTANFQDLTEAQMEGSIEQQEKNCLVLFVPVPYTVCSDATQIDFTFYPSGAEEEIDKIKSQLRIGVDIN